MRVGLGCFRSCGGRAVPLGRADEIGSCGGGARLDPRYIGEIALGNASSAAWVEPHGHIDAIYVASNDVESGLGVTIKTTP
jgi:hypothetical protein